MGESATCDVLLAGGHHLKHFYRGNHQASTPLPDTRQAEARNHVPTTSNQYCDYLDGYFTLGTPASGLVYNTNSTEVLFLHHEIEAGNSGSLPIGFDCPVPRPVTILWIEFLDRVNHDCNETRLLIFGNWNDTWTCFAHMTLECITIHYDTTVK